MKKILYSALLLGPIAFLLTSGVMDDNGRAGVTGAPGELTCNQSGCHTSFTLNSGTGSIRATSNMNNWTYVPGTTYTINVIVAKSGTPLFGVGAGILQSSGDNAGSLIITNSARTTIKTRVVGTYTRRNIVHNLNGGRANDSCVFSFNWTAPATNIGTVTLYAAGNCANSSGNTAGDYIYTMSQPIAPDASTFVSDLMQSSGSVNVFPNPAYESLGVSFENKTSGNVRILLTDLKGSLSNELFSGYVASGSFEQRFMLPSVPAGAYLITVEGDDLRLTRRVIIR